MNQTVKMILKGTIIGSTIVAANELLSAHTNPLRRGAGTRLVLNIAGISGGFYIGKKISDSVAFAIEDAIVAYNGED